MKIGERMIVLRAHGCVAGILYLPEVSEDKPPLLAFYRALGAHLTAAAKAYADARPTGAPFTLRLTLTKEAAEDGLLVRRTAVLTTGGLRREQTVKDRFDGMGYLTRSGEKREKRGGKKHLCVSHILQSKNSKTRE